MAKELLVGTLVTCKGAYPFIRELNLEGQVGIIFEARRDNCRVFYDTLSQTFWLPTEFLRPEKASSNAAGGLLAKLSYVLTSVNVSFCEFEARPEGDYKLSAHISGIDLRIIDDIKSYLGVNFLNLSILPQGMALVALELEFK